MEGETGAGEAREGYMCKSRCLGAAATSFTGTLMYLPRCLTLACAMDVTKKVDKIRITSK